MQKRCSTFENSPLTKYGHTTVGALIKSRLPLSFKYPATAKMNAAMWQSGCITHLRA
jgi:hypothetical protein